MKPLTFPQLSFNVLIDMEGFIGPVQGWYNHIDI
jgi:hypothetical protein